MRRCARPPPSHWLLKDRRARTPLVQIWYATACSAPPPHSLAFNRPSGSSSLHTNVVCDGELCIPPSVAFHRPLGRVASCSRGMFFPRAHLHYSTPLRQAAVETLFTRSPVVSRRCEKTVSYARPVASHTCGKTVSHEPSCVTQPRNFHEPRCGMQLRKNCCPRVSHCLMQQPENCLPRPHGMMMVMVVCQQQIPLLTWEIEN